MMSLRRDRSVLGHKVAKGTVRRVLHFAVPYRRALSIFMATVIAEALVGAVSPLLLRSIIDRAIPSKDTTLAIWLAIAAASALIGSAVYDVYGRSSIFAGTAVLMMICLVLARWRWNAQPALHDITG